jgi:hypothetical protein
MRSEAEQKALDETLKRQNDESAAALKAKLAEQRKQAEEWLNLQQALAVDMQRAVDADKKQRESADKWRDAGRMSDSEWEEFRRKELGW